MVDMAHYADDRRSRLKALLSVVLFAEKLLDDVHLLFFFTENVIIQSDFFRFVVFHFAVRRHDLAGKEQLLNDLRRIHVHSFRQLPDRELLGDRDRLDLFFKSRFHLLLGADELPGLVPGPSARIFFVVDEVLFGALIAFLVHLPLVVVSVLLVIPAEVFAFTGSSR